MPANRNKAKRYEKELNKITYQQRHEMSRASVVVYTGYLNAKYICFSSPDEKFLIHRQKRPRICQSQYIIERERVKLALIFEES